MSNHREQINKAFDLKVLKNINDTKRIVGLAVHGKLREVTPVDTSRATSNWWTDMNNIPTRILEEGDGGAQSDAMAATVLSKNITLADKIYIVNNLPYIRRLDEGYSKQAPAGMVAQSVQYGRAKAKEFAKGLK